MTLVGWSHIYWNYKGDKYNRKLSYQLSNYGS